MKIGHYITLFLTAVSFASLALAADTSETVYRREMGIKAAFIYNFIQFVEWPEKETSNANEPVVIGIVNTAGYEGAFDQIKDKKIAGRDILIKNLTLDNKIEDKDKNSEQDKIIETFKTCHVLFFYKIEGETLSRVTRKLKGCPVLLIGQKEGFLEQEGTINFIKEKDKIRFEINLAAVKNHNLTIRSKLLKLAKRVITEEK